MTRNENAAMIHFIIILKFILRWNSKERDDKMTNSKLKFSYNNLPMKYEPYLMLKNSRLDVFSAIKYKIISLGKLQHGKFFRWAFVNIIYTQGL